MLHHLKTAAVFFPPLVYRDNRTSQGRQTAEFLLNILKAFVALPVGYLVHGPAALLAPVLLILLVNFGDFRPQTHDLVLENSEMIHSVRIYQLPEERSEDAQE